MKLFWPLDVVEILCPEVQCPKSQKAKNTGRARESPDREPGRDRAPGLFTPGSQRPARKGRKPGLFTPGSLYLLPQCKQATVVDSLDINLAYAAIKIRPETFCYLLRVIARPSCAFWRSRCLPWIVQIFVPPAHRGWCLVQAPRWGVSRSFRERGSGVSNRYNLD